MFTVISNLCVESALGGSYDLKGNKFNNLLFDFVISGCTCNYLKECIAFEIMKALKQSNLFSLSLRKPQINTQ